MGFLVCLPIGGKGAGLEGGFAFHLGLWCVLLETVPGFASC